VSTLAVVEHTASSAEDHVKALALVADARARIALYGSDGTIKAVAEIANYPHLDNRKACQVFVHACQQMRADTPGCAPTSDDELSRVIFGERFQDMRET
jgi:hypothetical protein